MVVRSIHVNPNTGEPGKCSAKIACRYGDDTPHFEHERDARLYYEIKMEDGEAAGRKVFDVVNSARDFRRADEQLRIAKHRGTEAEAIRLAEERELAREQLEASGFEPQELIDSSRSALKNLSEIRTMVLQQKSPSQSYLERKTKVWDRRLDRVLSETADRDPAARDRALFTLKLSVIRELPTKRILDHARLSKSLESDFNVAGRAQRIARAIPGVSEAGDNRRASKVLPGREEEYISSALDRAADFFEKVNGSVAPQLQAANSR